ncbi:MULTISPECIES: Hsp20 family protein [unclassified Sinorhizobium]|uniref:Hsp20 family protein n=1 Tax=unclassified Sinorhizobium TaxID=2613772 RepID=UPI003525F362
MRTAFDFSPFYRSSVGFDRIFDLLDDANRAAPIDNWPPYDIIRTGEDQYRVAIAVAGFSQDEISIIHERNMLVVSGTKADEEKAEYLYRGIAGRNFARRFQVADHVTVTGASLVNGLLAIDLVRELPEGMKPRKIEIARDDSPAAGVHQIEGEKQVA